MELKASSSPEDTYSKLIKLLKENVKMGILEPSNALTRTGGSQYQRKTRHYDSSQILNQ